MRAFVDSSVWFAAAAKRDAQNERAKSILQSIDQRLTTDLVLAETWQLLKAQFGNDVADTFWERLRDGGVRMNPSSAPIWMRLRREASLPSESISFIDRTSFAMVERMGITRAATFNPEFAAYRPRRGRKRPFQILSEVHSEVFTALQEALLERRPVHVSHDGERQTVCPYILGHAAGEERAFALLVEASSSTKRPVRNQVDLPSAVEDRGRRFADAPWIEQDYPGLLQRCVDQVHLEATRLRQLGG
ncbi:PIN domain-containing protein [Bradyrhizobium sp. 139]|uniref:type II toxin-antitoxin system VapC family toxin n=1 Tax=Bradyrhizobium sp. 139 TaxID=2782616 RepID=UPI001FFB8A95|nr:PIN domain-containing protein [Bradyrhizobium sp. 139]MCK1744273.1 PIN domain-containing protein [Bradyrhizobium sp. 139]